jgi:tetratricopeptide (TPR) repeat protein
MTRPKARAPATDKPRWLALFETAETEIARGRSRAAALLLARSLELNPRQPAARRRLAEIRTAAGDIAGGLAGDPNLHLARALLAERRFEAALVALSALPPDARVLAMKAAALMDIGRYGEAASAAGEVADRFPDQPYAQLVHAGALRAQGETAAAIAAYAQCVDLDPGCAEAWLSLANLKTYRFSAGELEVMEAAVSAAELQAEDRAKLCFALGKAREDAGNYTLAFEAYACGNAIEKDRRAFRPDETTAYVRRSKALFTPAFFTARAGWGARAADPIFIVGLPRSGSTLVEQILASHPAIEGTHELPDLPMIAQTVTGYPEGLAALTRDACARLGEEYSRRTVPYRRLGRPRFIDKTPKNFLHIGFIRLILPNAKIVDVRRGPLDCGVSIFKQHFGLGFSCAFDLAHIGRYYADYVDLMAHFDRAAPGAVHRVIYEDLVANTEGEVRRLLAYLDLPFDPACLRFFENRRPVDTPSSEQVRQPIFTGGIGAWRSYEPWVGPLKESLGPALTDWRGDQASG